MRNISQKSLDELIKPFETFSSVPYLCPAKKLTIGWGHRMLSGEMLKIITKEKGQELLLNDVSVAAQCITKSVFCPLNDNQFDALVSLVFNIGINAFRSSTLLKLLNTENYERAANEFDRWVYADGKILAGLVNRRAREKALFLEGI